VGMCIVGGWGDVRSACRCTARMPAVPLGSRVLLRHVRLLT